VNPRRPPPKLSEPRIKLSALTEEYRQTLDRLEDFLAGAREARKDWPLPVRLPRGGGR
jgi:hypothetical protein